jgi:hypothetical protein
VPQENISMVRDTNYIASPDKTPTQFIELFEAYYGPTMNAIDAAQKDGKADELHSQLVELANSHNKSKGHRHVYPRNVYASDGLAAGGSRISKESA